MLIVHQISLSRPVVAQSSEDPDTYNEPPR
jgi:hypothetical protein